MAGVIKSAFLHMSIRRSFVEVHGVPDTMWSLIGTTSSKQRQMRWKCQLTPLASTIHRKAMPSRGEWHVPRPIYIYRPTLIPLHQAQKCDIIVDYLRVRHVKIRRHWKQGLLRCHQRDGHSAPLSTSETVYHSHSGMNSLPAPMGCHHNC